MSELAESPKVGTTLSGYIDLHPPIEKHIAVRLSPKVHLPWVRNGRNSKHTDRAKSLQGRQGAPLREAGLATRGRLGVELWRQPAETTRRHVTQRNMFSRGAYGSFFLAKENRAPLPYRYFKKKEYQYFLCLTRIIFYVYQSLHNPGYRRRLAPAIDNGRQRTEA